MPGSLHESSPRPDGDKDKKERRAQIVARFDNTIQTAVEQMRTQSSHTMASFEIKGIDLRYRLPVRDATLVHIFEVSQGLRTDDPQVFLETNFRPLFVKDGNKDVVGILRSSILEDEADKSRRRIAQRVLTLQEMEQLVDAMASPPLHVSTIEDLTKPTDSDQDYIDAALATRDRAVEAYHSRR